MVYRLTLRVSLAYTVGLFAILLTLLLSTQVRAQEQALTFTVSPPLFQLHLKPGETWRGGVSVLNSNAYDITLFTEPVLFRPQGETGRPSFVLPGRGSVSEPDPTTLAGWITTPQGGILVPREGTVTIPLEIRIPDDASPGGHYAALLIGTRAPDGASEGSAVSVSSSIASLVFLRVAGDVLEQARIREFSTERGVYPTAEARFSMRFENQGNVHLRPQGYITIYNMFGKQRGRIEVNAGNDYGNVLPGSVRKYSFFWESDGGSWDIGRYRAEATIGYGNEEKRFSSANVYFWVLPIMPFLQVIGVLLGAILVFGWAVRVYVRRVLALERIRRPEGTMQEVEQPSSRHHISTLERLVLPLQADSSVDLRNRNARAHGTIPLGADKKGDTETKKGKNIVTFVLTYRYVLAFLAFVIAIWFAGKAFFADVLVYERPYEVYEEREEVMPPYWDTGVPVE